MKIGLIGKLGSGKTFAANYLVEQYGFSKLSLADPIKTIMAEYFDVTSKEDPRYRGLAQKIGTDWFRSEDSDVWVKNLQKRANGLSCDIVVDDVRFVNEAEYMLDNDWMLIYLECPDEIRIQRCTTRDGVFDASRMNHPSETGVDDIMEKYDIKIIKVDSSGSIENTNDQLDFLLSVG